MSYSTSVPLDVRPPKWLQPAAVILATFTVVMAPLAVGATHPTSILVFTATALVALLLLVVDKMIQRRSLRWSWLGLPLLLSAAWTSLQLLPLPHGLRALLSPAATSRIDFVTSLLPEATQALVRPVLSIDPPQTAAALMRLVCALAVFVVIADRSKRPQFRRLVFRIILLGAVMLLCVSAGHRFLHLHKIYGVIHVDNSTPLYGPLINPNHLARAFGAFALFCLGRAKFVRGKIEATAFLTVGLACAAAVIFTESRGGMLALIVGGGALVAMLPIFSEQQTGPQRSSSMTRLFMRIVAVVALCIGCYLIATVIAPELLSVSIERTKLGIYRPALGMLSDYGLVGAGNDGFRAAFTSVLDQLQLQTHGTYTHAENFFVQLLVDQGVLAGTAIMASCVWLFVRVLRTKSLRSKAQALPVLIFLVVGDVVDFALQATFGLLLAALALGICAGCQFETKKSAVELGTKGLGVKIPAKRAFVMWAGLAVLNLLLGTLVHGDAHYDVEKALQNAPATKKGPIFARAMARHPHVGYYAYGLAVDARQHRDRKRALSWANRALLLNPELHPAHLEAARALMSLGKIDQALGEYRHAWSAFTEKAVLRDVLRDARRFKLDFVRLKKSIPPGSEGRQLRFCGALAQQKRYQIAQTCFDDAVHIFASTDARRLAAINALSRKDYAHVLQLTSPDGKDEKTPSALAVLALRAVAGTSGYAEALRRSTAWLSHIKDPAPFLQWRVIAALAAQDKVGARTALTAWRRTAKGPQSVLAIQQMEVKVLVLEDQLAKALRLVMRLQRRKPTAVPLLQQAARLQMRLGLKADAIRSLQKAAGLAPSNTAVLSLLKQLTASSD